ncbi:MAG TPA: 4-(cytidine 5'-diphospho)-2-C-methyl-D-erythritol kinase [Longimicrobiales bacterium]
MTHTHYAPAKINLWLRVFQSDATGYHPLDTLFCAIDLCDRIEITTTGKGIHLAVQGADLGAVEQNLAYRAAREYYLAVGLPPSLQMTLHKNIPVGAGLGGGSSDAAAVLHALQMMHDNRLPESDLLALAARLGSDVPFFLCGSHLARATGRGEVLHALPQLPQRNVLVLMPPFAINTREAYQWLDNDGGLTAANVHETQADSWDDVAKAAVNDFEKVLFARFPQLRQLRDALHASGAAIALLSGSGSALFGVYADAGRAEQARSELASRFGDVAIYPAQTMK